MPRTSTSFVEAMQRMPPTANTESQHARRAQAINRAKALEARTNQKYVQGMSILLAAVQEAFATRAMAACAAARVSRGTISRVLSAGYGRGTNVGMRLKTTAYFLLQLSFGRW